MNICLELPVPQCMRDFVPRDLPPSRFDLQTSAKVDSLISEFGNRLGRDENEIEKCCQLAEGSDDLLILLKRPSRDHNYGEPFDVFVSQSPTLRALDELIRFASFGLRDLRSTTMLDLYTMNPKRKQPENIRVRPSDEQCRDLVQSIIQLKRPKVVLRCTSSTNGLNLRGERGVPCKNRKNFDGNALQFFHIFSVHPSNCVNYNKWRGESRLALIYHCILAMRCLEGRAETPTWSSPLTSLSFETIYQSPESETKLLRSSLRRIHALERRGVRRRQEIQEEVIVEDVFDLLWLLNEVQSVKEGLEGACALRLWQTSFEKNPFQNFFSSQLSALAEKQELLLDDEKRLAEDMKKMTLSPTRMATSPALTAWERKITILEDFHESMWRTKDQFVQIKNTVDYIMQNVAVSEKCRQVGRFVLVDGDVVTSCHDLLQYFFDLWQEFAAQVCALPALLDEPCTYMDNGDAGVSILQDKSARTRVQKVLEDILRVVDSMRPTRVVIQALILKDIRACFTGADKCEATETLLVFYDELIGIICSSDGSQKEKLREGFQTIIELRLSLARTKDFVDKGEGAPDSDIQAKSKTDRGFAGLYTDLILKDMGANLKPRA